MDKQNDKTDIEESEIVDLLTVCDNCGEFLPLNVWGEKHSICKNCGRKLECCWIGFLSRENFVKLGLQ